MVVQHNLQAMNANRMLGITTKEASGSTEKLSSGYRINRAADDAAGLAISEKMKNRSEVFHRLLPMQRMVSPVYRQRKERWLKYRICCRE